MTKYPLKAAFKIFFYMINFCFFAKENVYQNIQLTMTIIKRVLAQNLIFFLVIVNLLYSCSSGKNNEKDNIEENDTIKTTVLNVGGELFSIPSPAQTAILVQKSGIVYDKTVLSSANLVNNYTTDFMRAMNMGIYGADLGYVSLYNQTQDAISYLSAVKQLSDKLGLSTAFDQKTMARLQNNLTNRDSMMVLVSLAYQTSDTYLKNSQRNELSSLILCGGWIEGMHFSLMAVKANKSEQIRYRIAEQKQALESILRVLSKNKDKEVVEITSMISELDKIYQGVIFKYNFVEPITDTIKKITYINSSTEIVLTDEQLLQITNKIEEIRNKIINTTKS